MDSTLHTPISLLFDPNPQNPILRNQNLWEEIKTSGSLPRRRSNHAACCVANSLVIHGGQDIGEGVLDDIWVLDLDDETNDMLEWTRIEQTGDIPPPTCRHTAVSHNDLMYIFGGNDLINETNDLYIFDILKESWTKVPSKNPQLPPCIDSHSACKYESTDLVLMIIFGGFIKGERSNRVYTLNLVTLEWNLLNTSTPAPLPRSDGCTVVHSEYMYLFGGAAEGDKLNDLWKLDIHKGIWHEIRAAGQEPSPRSGHSGCLLGDSIVIFGGIQNITRETNDMFSYDILKNEWVCTHLEFKLEDPVSAQDIEDFKLMASFRPKTRTSTSSRSPKSPRSGRSPHSSDERKVNTSLKKRKTIYDGPPMPILGRIRGRVPYPRDGHTAVKIHSKMYVFGGDRHQMPFNDLYAYSLEENSIKLQIP